MKIIALEPIPILVPLKQGLTTKTAHGEHIDSPYVLLKVHTDAGLVGLGEATLAPRWSGETSPGCVAVLRDVLAPAVIGADPRDVRDIGLRVGKALRLNPFAKAAVEMACWDLAGKASGLPVYRLLGGRVRAAVPMKMVVGAFDVPRAVALAKRFLDGGTRHLKVKVGLDPTQDIERVRAVRELAGPEITIGIDANCGWSPATARRVLQELQAFDILFAEQPVGTDDPRALAEVRAATTIPIMADESVFTPQQALEIVRLGAADILAVYPGKNAGISGSLAIAEIAAAAGLCCSMGSNLELGIATAAMLHLAVACPTIDSESYPGDLLGPLYHEADMITERLTLGPELALAPEGPGLGVELDEDQVERFRDRSQP
ncbi:MAG TPA: mandelate racemase/muconate lactonizing protein [Candidatus Latescibacteria bacterium]|jgi:muconate cycloisomerase|nr:mandelate racemase/muconate lactonizing protein [Candidatus Latescibacterota bacterium]|tara:strand:- start:520 stop:1644 length:1125 start_codon:yes stop_codon:yes gene_type:complete